MAEEGSALDLEGFEKRLQSLFTNGCSSHALQVDGKTFCSGFRKLVEEYTYHWQTPLPQLRILEIALCYFDRESYSFPVGCDEVHYMLSSLALSVFELLLFFDKNDFDQDPLKHFTVTFQECHMSLARHQNVHLLEVSNCLQDGGPWGNVTLQSILTQSTLPQTEVDRYISAQLPVLLELRVRYLLTCERVSEAMALAKCCSQHPTAGEHPFFLQVYLTWLHKTSQNKELGNDGLQFCVELCTKALQSCDDISTKSLIYKTIAGLFQNDLEMCRACALLVYFLEPTVEAYKMVFQLYTQPDQEYNADASPVSNQVRFELLQVLKKGLHFDPEFCDLIALRANCKNLMSETAESAALEEILEWVPDNCIKETDLHLSIHSSNFQQRTEVAHQAGAKKRQTKDDKKNHMTTERGTASTDIAAASASSVDHAVMTKEKRAVNETPVLDSFWQSFLQLDKMYHSLIPPRFSEKKRPRRKIRKPRWLMEYSETAEDLEKASTSSEIHEDLDEASSSSETPEVLEEASTSLLTKIKPAVVVLSRLPRINKASTLLLVKMKSAIVVLNRLPQIDKASSSLLAEMNPAAVVLPKLPQLHEASSSLLVNEAGSCGPTQAPPAVVVLPEHSSQAAPLPLVLLQQCIREEEGEWVSVGFEGEDTVPVGSDTCWDPKLDQNSELECNQSETLTPQAISNGLMSAAPELTRRDGTGQGRDSSPHPGVTSQTSQTLVFSCPECLFSFTSQAFLHRHMKRRHKDIYCQWNGQIPSAACHQITSTACLDLVYIGTLGDKSPPSTPVPGDPPCISSATDPKREDTDQQIPYSHQRFIKTLFIKTLTQPGEVKTRHLIHTGKKTHNCEWCDMSFNKLDGLRNHQTLHTGVKPFQCEECGMGYTSLFRLRKHLTLHTGEKTFHCEECGESFSNEQFLKKHQRCHSGVKYFQCEQCDMNFGRLSSLRNHLTLHTGEKPFHCKECSKSFSSKVYLKKHQRYHGVKPWQCDVCDKRFIWLRDLKVHKHVHTDVQPFHCELCNTGFSHSHHLKEHQLIHIDEMPFRCKVCDMSFSSEQYLKEHLRIHLGERPSDNLRTHLIHNGQKPFSCKVCAKNFSWKSNLRKHLRTHIGKKTYDSKVYGLNFSQKSNLKKHLRTQTGEKPYDSNVCGKNLCQKDNLKKRLRIHTGEKTYNCKVCGKNFSRKDNLETHLRIHTGEKPFRCKVCGKNFGRKDNLRKHRICLHGGEYTYDCKVCGKNFSRRDKLKKHLLIHTGEKTYYCKVCEKKFCLKGNLKKHLRIHAGEKTYDSKLCENFCHTGEKTYDCKDCGKHFNDGRHLNNHECFHLFDDTIPNYGHGITGEHSQTMADLQAHGTWEHDALVDRMWVGDMCEISTDYAHDDALVTGEINGHATGDAHNTLVDDIIEIIDYD